MFHSIVHPCFGLVALGAASALSAGASTVMIAPFGKLSDGREAALYSLSNANGVRADITNYGAIVVRLFMPDRAGRMDDVVLGYNTVEDYVKATPYFGAVVGRYGNRIAQGKFTLEGKNYTLATNNSPGNIPCHLHGGAVGFDKVLWSAEALLQGNTPGLKLRYLSKDGEEGYPGNLDVTVQYWLDNDNSLGSSITRPPIGPHRSTSRTIRISTCAAKAPATFSVTY